jgi:hypothetical protein
MNSEELFGSTDPFPKASRAMRKAMKQRPEVERLESMTLLSGVAGTVQEAVKIPNPVHLVGTVKGTFMPEGPTSGEIKNLSGTLKPFGHLSEKKAIPISLTGASQNLTLTSPAGNLTFRVNLTVTPQTGFSGTYTVVGGTKALTGEMGSGNLSVNLTSTKFTATFS